MTSQKRLTNLEVNKRTFQLKPSLFEIRADFNDGTHYLISINENDFARTVSGHLQVFAQRILREPTQNI